jgi:hypothetical protein
MMTSSRAGVVWLGSRLLQIGSSKKMWKTGEISIIAGYYGGKGRAGMNITLGLSS